MKKVFAVMAVAGMFAFVACGPKAEEQATDAAEATEQVMEDAANDMSAAAEEATDATMDAANEAGESMEAAADSVAAAVTPEEGTAE